LQQKKGEILFCVASLQRNIKVPENLTITNASDNNELKTFNTEKSSSADSIAFTITTLYYHNNFCRQNDKHIR